jgi:programmed cell death protein 5
MEPATVNPGELPDGFSTADPNNPGGGGPANGGDQQKQQIQEQKQMVLEQACTREALARLGRIKLVKPDKAAQVENTIVSMAMQGKLPGKISEDKLIEILERGNRKSAAGEQSGIKIQRKKYAFDSDDDDDDDEDLL